jgi:hypothetical protein
MYLLDDYRVNEDSCDSNFDYLVDLLIRVRDNDQCITIDAQYINIRKCVLSYKDFTPALHYNSIIHRIVVSKRIDILILLDEYKEGLVDWWIVLQSLVSSYNEHHLLQEEISELEKMAWDGILKRNQLDIHVYFFCVPRLFVYAYTHLYSLPYHTNLYDLKKEFRNQLLDPNINWFSKDWLNHKEAREIFIKIRNSYYSSDDCIENRYIQFIREEQEKQCKLTILSIFLPKSLRDIIKYTIASYL